MNYLEVGGIYRGELFQDRSIRIVAFDRIETLYEIHYGNSWMSEALSYKEFYFNRIPTGAFLAMKPDKVGFIEYTADQKAILKLHLPISVGRSRKLSWSRICNEGLERDLDMLTGTFITEALYLYPLGPKGGVKGAKKLVANNGLSFTIDELVSKSAAVQCGHYADTQPGIGIFRGGMKNGLPSFYIDGFYSKGDAYKLEEEGFDWALHFEKGRKADEPVIIYRFTEFGRFRAELTSSELRKKCTILTVQVPLAKKELHILKSVDEVFDIDLRGFPLGSYRLEFGDENEVIQIWMLTLSSAVDYPLVQR